MTQPWNHLKRSLYFVSRKYPIFNDCNFRISNHVSVRFVSPQSIVHLNFDLYQTSNEHIEFAHFSVKVLETQILSLGFDWISICNFCTSMLRTNLRHRMNSFVAYLAVCHISRISLWNKLSVSIRSRNEIGCRLLNSCGFFCCLCNANEMSKAKRF